MACEGSDKMVKGGFCAPAELFWSDYLANTLGVTGRGHWCAAHMINHSLHTFLCRHHSNRNCVVLSKQQAVGNKGHQIPQKEDELELGIGMRYCMLYLCPSPWLTDGSTTVQSSRTLPHIFDTAPIWQQMLSADRWTVRNVPWTLYPGTSFPPTPVTFTADQIRRQWWDSSQASLCSPMMWGPGFSKTVSVEHFIFISFIFRISLNPQKVTVRSRGHTLCPFQRRYIPVAHPTIPQYLPNNGGGSVMAWDCLAASGNESLMFVDIYISKSMNSEVYIAIISTQIAPNVAKLIGQHFWVGKRDNDPKHTA